MDSDADLSIVAEHLRDSPEFLAGWLAATPGLDRLLSRLGLDAAARQRLLLCRAPRPDRFVDDVAAVASYLGLDPLALATVLREASVLAALTTQPLADASRDLLAAAHDTVDEQLPRSAGTARMRSLAESTWAAAPVPARQARDVEAAVAWSSPVAVVSLPHLGLPGVNAWLTARGIPALDGGTDAPLRGLMVAWRGHGIIFVDGTLTAPERRFVVAHEHGHFLLDYLEPRRRVLADAPELLAVVDAQRPPTSADRARASLARVPLGLHRHLLERDTGGGVVQDVVASEDDASQYAFELLTPWDEVVRRVGEVVNDGHQYEQALSAATDAVRDAFQLPTDAAAARAAAALSALDIRPGFFER